MYAGRLESSADEIASNVTQDPYLCRYIHLPGSLNVADRVEAKQREVAKARKAHAIALGQQAALPKGKDATALSNAGEEGHPTADEGSGEETSMSLDAAEDSIDELPQLAEGGA